MHGLTSLKLENSYNEVQIYQVEATLLKGNSGPKTASSNHADSVPHLNTSQRIGDTIPLFSEIRKEWRDAKLVINEMESQQTCLLTVLDDLKQENRRFLELPGSIHMVRHFTQQLESYAQISEGSNTTKFKYLDSEQMTECGGTTRQNLPAVL